MNLRRASGPLLLLLALAAASRPASAEPLLTAPREGVELTAGSLAVVAWEDAPAEAVEWEAFLSVDGGRSYPMRITPHLDLSIRRFTFHVPPFPTRDGRILLRFGDERREVGFETPQRFSIAPGAAAWPAAVRIALSRGEKARSRDPGVVVWIEGARDGSGLRVVVRETEVSSVRSVEPAHLPWIPLLWPSPNRSVLAAPAVPSTAARTPLPLRHETVAASPPLLTSVRLLTGRLNE